MGVSYKCYVGTLYDVRDVEIELKLVVKTKHKYNTNK